MLGLKEVNLSETRFYQDVLEKGIEQGLEQGLEQWLEQGLRKGESDLVLRLLQKRCGMISIDYLR